MRTDRCAAVPCRPDLESNYLAHGWPDGFDSQQIQKLFDSQSGLSNDRTKSAAIEFVMVRNGHLAERTCASQNDVTAMLAHLNESNFLQ